MSTVYVQVPEKVELENTDSNLGKFIFQPLEKGFGVTLGNTMRRVLLSSIPGYAVTSVRIDGVIHEFSTIKGVMEDVTEIILNLKKVRLKLHDKKFAQVNLALKGKREFKAGDIAESYPEIEILNPNQHIATLTKDNAKLEISLTINRGKGYATADENKIVNAVEGTIAIDSIFTPIKNVVYFVEATRVGQQIDFEKLILEVETDGSITPENSVVTAAKVLRDHFQPFISLSKDIADEKVTAEDLPEFMRIKKILQTNMDEIELSVRSRNCLQAANIKIFSELVAYTESELLGMRNFGRKSLSELQQVVENFGLNFGFDVTKYIEND